MFNTLLKELRSKKGLTQGQLAKEVGVSPGNVGDWETGKSKPGYNALAALARIFEVSADYLLEIDQPLEKKSDDLEAYKKEQGLTCDGSPLSALEADLIAMFRLLPPMRQEELFDAAYFQYTRYVEQKKGSIYSTYFAEGEPQKSGPVESLETQDGTA
jgi:transcriptional regulator with XRE-family HTH domain